MNLSPASQTPTVNTLPYAGVTFNLPVRETFTYEIPSHFRGRVQVGMRVFVPFGRRKLTGYVVSLTDRNDKNISLKSIEDLPDTEPVISRELLSLTRWVADYYHASWGEAIKAALPAGLDDESEEVLSLTDKGARALQTDLLSPEGFGILRRVGERGRISAKQLRRALKDKARGYTLARLKQDGYLRGEVQIKRSTVGYVYEKRIRLAPKAPPEKHVEKLLARSPRQKELFQRLAAGEQTIASLANINPSYSGPLRALQKKGLAEVFTVKTARGTGADARTDPIRKGPIQFTLEQERIYGEVCRSIDEGVFRTFLLHGVTGSGKTEIYIRCIHRALDRGKTAIMMVPEISLTPQTVTRFRERFGNRVAIMHSGMSPAERFLEWKKIREGKVSIVVGARSAVFAPLINPGVIVIDEEHDTSYKQDSNPRYHARDTAIVRARALNAVVVLGSATPSLESLKNTETGKYNYLSLPKRVQDRLLPVIRITDMTREKTEKRNFSILSLSLKKAIRDRLDRGEQVFLFLNRRGTAHYVFCRECGFVFDCIRCSVSLTFHGKDDILRCHYCNYTTRTPDRCADCGGEVIRFTGFGTQKLEAETRQLFPEARIIRLDRDTTRSRTAFESMHELMTAGKVDILIGTQMITKGHDFPGVTLVGVVNADLSLHIPEFRSCERTFQLLTQVAGRAGRGKVPGQVLIQTHNANHYVFDQVRDHDYRAFYERELRFRKKLNYPPFTRLAVLGIESGKEALAQELARRLQRSLARMLNHQKGVELLGPSPAALYRINNKFRWHLILRAQRIQSLQSLLDRCVQLPELQSTDPARIRWFVDVDPVSLL